MTDAVRRVQRDHRSPLTRVIDHRGVKLRLHVHDDFKEEEHPRGEGGKFAVGGSGGSFQQLTPEHRMHLHEVGKIANRYGYKNLPTTENASHAMWTRGDDTEHNQERHILRAYTKHDWDVDEVKGKPFWYNQKGAGTSGMGAGTKGLEEHLRELHGGKTNDMLTRVFKIRDHRVFLHFHDDFVASEHPHAPPGSSKGGQFVKGSGGGATTKTTAKETTHTIKVPTKTKKPRASVSSNFLPIEKNEKGEWQLVGGGKPPKHLAKFLEYKVIPPKWTQVKFNPDPNGGLMVVGRDSKNRQQPLYSEKHDKKQAANKFGRTQVLDAGKFDEIVKKNNQAKKSRDARVRDLASVCSLIMNTGIRPGGEADTGADYKSYGATTLEGRHVKIDDNGKMTLVYVAGKHKGKDVTIEVDDPAVVADLHERVKQAGLDGQLFPNADARRLLQHVKSIAGKSFKTKDFRTLIGTQVANCEVERMTKAGQVPTTPAEYKKFVKMVATVVSQKLGNTPTVAQQSYIAPHVFAEWKMSSGA